MGLLGHAVEATTNHLEQAATLIKTSVMTSPSWEAHKNELYKLDTPRGQRESLSSRGGPGFYVTPIRRICSQEPLS